MRAYTFTLAISAEQYKAYYRGQVLSIQVRSHDGKNLRFPASAIRPLVSAEGVYGEFELHVDDNNKLLGISRKTGKPTT